jgi:gas vesicle protein
MNRETGTGFFSGFIFGALVGAAIALLYAPQSGLETRRIVKERAYEAKDNINKAAGKLKDEVTSRIHREKE